MRVLLVDDDRAVLRAMERLVLRMRPDCSVRSISDGKAAIAALDAEPFDLVLTDIRMPGINGVEVLRHAQSSRPEAVRVAVSGYAAPPEVRGTLDVAHRFFDKPVNVGLLREAIDRANSLHERVGDITVKRALLAMNNLPSAPALFAQLCRVLADPDRPVGHLVGIIARDDALAARLLQVANSAFYGATYRTTNVFDAVLRVGSNTLQSLALSIGAFRSFSATDRCDGFSIEAHEAHSFLVARIAARLVNNAESEDAFAVALLHDIGKLVFASRMPKDFAPLLARASREGQPLITIERGAGFTPHAEAGAQLLGAWGLPQSVVDAVEHHHDPSQLHSGPWGPQHAVHVADFLVHEADATRGSIPGTAVPPLDRAMLSTLGVEGHLDDWRSIALDEIENPPEDEEE